MRATRRVEVLGLDVCLRQHVDAAAATGITNRIGTSEGYTFSYSTGTLTEPFAGAAWSGGANTRFLTGMTVSGVGLSYAMAYQGSWPRGTA